MSKSKSVDTLSYLGLSEKDSRIFVTLLKEGAMNATNLSRALSLPRTSVLLLLEGLTQKGLVARLKVGGHFEYQSVEVDVLETLFREQFKEFESSIPFFRELAREQTLNKKFSVKVFTGASGLLQAYYKILSVPRGGRIHYFEGGESVRHKMKMRDESLIKWQEAFKKSGIIIEALGSRTAFKEVMRKKGSRVLASHRNRLIVAYELPEEIYNFPCDIAVLPNTVIFFMPKDEHAVVVDSSDLASSFRLIFKGLVMVSKKVDWSKAVDELLTSETL